MVVVSQPVVDHLQIESRQWLIVGLLSLLLHAGLVLWFSAQRSGHITADSNDFKVGLVTSEGIGQSIEASSSNIAAVSEVVTDQQGIVTPHDSINNIAPTQAIEITEQLPAIEHVLTEDIELAVVVMPEASLVSDVSPPALRADEKTIENQVDESRPVEAVNLTIPSAASVEVDITETMGVSADIANADLVDDFFKPADILAKNDSMKTLPAEQLMAVPAPDAIRSDNNPELANDDVEILEIIAQEVLVQRKPKTVIKQTGVGNNPLHPEQNLTSNSEPGSVFEKTNQTAEKKLEKPAPITVPRTYVLELKAFLKLHKQYPVQAHRLRQEGVVIMGLVIDRSGEIISYDIKRSSGHKLLDQEVERMIQRAAKMPALPDGFQNDTLELLIPIRFKVKS